MKHLVDRTKQFGSTLLTRTLRQPELIQGYGSLSELPKLIQNEKYSSIFVVTTPGCLRRGMLTDFLAAIESGSMQATIFSDVEPDPTVRCIEQAANAYRSGDCELTIAIGGGSVMDCAKGAMARVAKPEQPLRDMAGTLKIRKKLPPIYAVPTTAGTGSETTACTVITDTVDGTHYKLPVCDPCLVPHIAVLDPALTISLPPEITAATGMDALTHAVEAFTNLFATRLVRKNAVRAVQLIYQNLLKAYHNGIDVAARENMLEASYCAGIAFTRNFTGNVHAVAHGIGGLYGMPHGMANAIILPYVLEQYGESVEKKLSELAEAVGIQGKSDAERSEKFIRSIHELNRSMNIPDKLFPLKREDFNVIIHRAMAEANPTYPVPQIWGYSEFERLLNKLVVESK